VTTNSEIFIAPAERRAAETWDNEGGHAAAPDVDLSAPPVSEERQSLIERLNFMRKRLSESLIGGREGTHTKMYEHRARVVRQFETRLRALGPVLAVARVRP